MNPNKDIDSGYAWVVFLGDFCCYLVVGGSFYTNGLLILSMVKDYQWDITSTALVGSLFYGTSSIVGPLTGFVASKTSSRFAMMFGGLLLVIGNVSSSFAPNVKIMAFTSAIRGLGIGFTFVPMSAITSYYFRRYLNVVSGISASGAGFGTLICSIIIEYSMRTYSLRGTFFVLASLSAQICFFGALCRPNEIEKKKHEQHRVDNKDSDKVGSFQLLKNLPLLMFCLSFFCWSMGVSIILMFLPMYCRQHGSNSQERAMVFTLIGAANIATRIMIGVAANADNINELTLYMGSFGVSGIVTLLLPFYIKTLPGQLAYGIIVSLFIEGIYSCLNSLNLKLVGISHVTIATGLEMFFHGIGQCVGPIVGAAIKERTDSMDIVFITAGISFLMASFSAMSMTVFQSPVSKRLQECTLKEDTSPITQQMLPVYDQMKEIPSNTDNQTQNKSSSLVLDETETSLLS